MFRKVIFIVCLVPFFWSNLLSEDNNSLNFDKFEKVGVHRIVNRKILELSKEASYSVIESKANLFKLENLINLFSVILESDPVVKLKSQEIKKAKKNIDDLEVLIKEKLEKSAHESNRSNAQKILKLLAFFKDLLDNPNFLDKNIRTKFLDFAYHKPIEFIGNHKVGTSIFLALAALAGAGFRCLKKLNKDINDFYDEVARESSLYKNDDDFLDDDLQDVIDGEERGDPFRDSANLIEDCVQQEDLLSGSDASESEVDDDVDRILLPRETNTRYDFRKPKLNMTIRFKEVVADGKKRKKYGPYLRLFE